MRRIRGWMCLLVLALPGWAGAVQAGSPAPASHVGTLTVQRFGDHGRPVILIPGLDCGPWEWQQTITGLQKTHVVYAVTLAGFDGTPPPARMTGLLDQADASLLKLIEQDHLDKPVLVGHSLGGTLALRFAGEHPRLISGVVAVEGLPIFPGMDQATAAQREAAAQRVRAQYAKMGPAQYRKAAFEYMEYVGVVDPKLTARYAPMLDRSSPATTAGYMAEDLLADYRPLLKHADVPILEISPYNAPDFQRAAAMAGQPVTTEVQKAAYYQGLLADAPDARVVSISPSRHFVMLDQPAKFRNTLDAFLESLPSVPGTGH